MKRIIVYGSLTLILVAIISVWSAGTWLLGYPGGVRWLLHELSQRTPVTVTARNVSGGIGKQLRVEGVTFRWPHGEATVEELRLSCRPLWLPLGHLAVQELSLRTVRIRDNRPDDGKPPELIWPQLTGIPLWLDAWVDHLQVENLTYQRLTQTPVAITRLFTALDWRHATLTATSLELVIPQGSVSGAITAGFGRPALVASLTATPKVPAAGFSRFDIRTRLLPGKRQEQLAGPLTLTTYKGARQELVLSSNITTARDSLNVTGINLIQTGRRGTLGGEGKVTFTTAEPRLRLSLRTSRLDLAQETGTPTNLSGKVTLEGTATRYSGRFDLANEGKTWQTASFSGTFTGDDSGIDFPTLDCRLLGGIVTGNLKFGWHNGLSLTSSLRGDKLDPALITPDWNGVLNLDLRGSAACLATGPIRTSLSCGLRASRLRGQPLSGEIRAHSVGETVAIERLFLEGNGFTINANGDLRKRLNVAATITDLSGIVPRTAGALKLSGWVRHAADQTGAEFTGHGREIKGNGIEIHEAELAARIDTKPGFPLELTARMKGITRNHLHADSATLELHGTPERHTLLIALQSGEGRIRGTASGGYSQSTWRGVITALSGQDRIGPWKLAGSTPLTISPESVSLSPLRFTGIGTGQLELAGRILLHPIRGELRATWSGIDLSHLDHWLKATQLTGKSSGTLRMESPSGESITVVAHVNATGLVSTAQRSVTIRDASLDLEANERGIHAALNLKTNEGIGLRSSFTSLSPARLRIPRQGELNATWEGIDLALLHGILPPEVQMNGTLSGTVLGSLLPEERLDLKGTAVLNNGAVQWRNGPRRISAKVKKGDLSWSWRGEELNCTASLALNGHGEATAQVTLPLPARLSTSLNPEGPLRGSLKGNFHENGLLTNLFPGLLRESRGDVALDLKAQGSWAKPDLTGHLELSKAGAYLPSAGVPLKELQLTASIEPGLIKVERFAVASGEGALNGSALVQLSGFQVTGYKGSITGSRFQVIRLPELQTLATPDMTFEGTPEKLTLRGNIKIPELMAKGSDKTAAVQPSRDVIVVRSETAPLSRQSRMALDIRLRIELGDKVFVKEAGLDAKLEGALELTLQDVKNIKGTGEIRVAKGRYSTYGVTMDIKRGRVIFAGGPVEQPTLDILALREIGDIKAGVTIRGTPSSPLVKLYSDPAMPDVDILSLIVLGRKPNATEDKSGLLMQAASFLSSTGESVFLQEQIKNRLGFDTFEVTTSKQNTSNYTKLEPTLLGTDQKNSTSSITESMLQVGKYLTPQLYVSYGWSLFDSSHIFKIRYSITNRWEIESRTSTQATGGDIFYKIEFD